MRSSSYDDQEFTYDVTVRIMEARDEFFLFMKDFDEDLHGDKHDEDWECLIWFFDRWVFKKVDWHGGVANVAERAAIGAPPTSYKGPGTREFESFNQLLPHILLAVIDEALRYPELLDAAPVKPDGTLRRRFRRTIPYLISSTAADQRYRARPRYEEHYDDAFAVTVLMEPFPPIVSTFEK